MKAVIADIKPMAAHDGPGIRTTVFFKGCPLRCQWCHNPETLSSRPQLAYYAHKCINCMECVAVCPQKAHTFRDGVHIFHRERCTGCGACQRVCLGEALRLYGEEVTVDSLLPRLLRDKPFYDSSGGGVTLSGGECLMQADFCRELLKALKQEGIHTAVDTCGFVPRQALEKVAEFTDLFLYDLKAFDPQVHIACTGQDNGLILENLQYLDSLGKAIEIRIPYVPGHNHRQPELLEPVIRGLSHVTHTEILPYHNYAGSKYEALGLKNTLPEALPTKEQTDALQARFL